MINQVKAGDLIELGSRIEGMVQKSKLLEQQLAAANARVAQLESTIAACKAAGWVSAATPPSDGRLVLTVRRGCYPQIAVYRPDVMEAFPWRSDHNINVAVSVPEWWMELPRHPAAEAAKGGREG